MDDLYRVRVLSTESIQPLNTVWETLVLYCGGAIFQDRIAYHGSKPLDHLTTVVGEPTRETLFEVIRDGETLNPNDDVIEEVSSLHERQDDANVGEPSREMVCEVIKDGDTLNPDYHIVERIAPELRES